MERDEAQTLTHLVTHTSTHKSDTNTDTRKISGGITRLERDEAQAPEGGLRRAVAEIGAGRGGVGWGGVGRGGIGKR